MSFSWQSAAAGVSNLMDTDLGTWLGAHRVVDPPGFLPQAAHVLDPTPVCGPTEAIVDVNRLVLDATSMRQLRESYGDAGIGAAVVRIVAERGKMHNPVTGSGGIACGVIREIGARYPAPPEFLPGNAVATLASLTLIPLRLDEVIAVDAESGHLIVRGTAILAASAPAALIPDDLPLDVVLAAFDVAGAPAHVRHLAERGDSVLIVGAGGNAGLLSLVAARDAVGSAGRVVALDWSEDALARIRALDLADAIVLGDATMPLPVSRTVRDQLPAGADLTVSVVNVPECEATCYLNTKPDGKILFFSMATSFTRATLGAEGIGVTAPMFIGNGFSPDLGQVALDLLRSSEPLLGIFQARYDHGA